MRTRLEFIRWNDASGNDGAFDPDEIKTDYIVHSAGIFVKETAKTVVLAQDCFPRTGRVRAYECIHKVNIISRKSVYMKADDIKHSKPKKGR